MISLVLIVCLSAEPAFCRQEHLPVELGAYECYGIRAQSEAIRWLDEHPAMELRGWRCEPAGKDA